MKMIKFRIIVILSLMLIVINLSSATQAAWLSVSELTPAPENIFPTAGDEIWPSIELFENKVHLTYVSSNKVYYTKWSGTEWTKADGTAGKDDLTIVVGHQNADPKVKLDGSGNPKIIFRDLTQAKIIYTQWSPAACGGSGCWTQADGVTSSPSYNEIMPDTATVDYLLDDQDNPHFVGRKEPGGTEVLYTRWTPGIGWTYADQITGGYEQVGIISGTAIWPRVLTYNNQPMIVTDGTDEILYTQWTPSVGWTKSDGTTLGYENISNSVLKSDRPLMVIDSQSNLSVFWNEGPVGSSDIYHSQLTKATNTWTQADGLTLGKENISNQGGNTRYSAYLQPITIDNFGRKGLIWQSDSDGDSDIYYTKYLPGIGWAKANGVAGKDNVSNTSDPSSGGLVKFDSLGNPSIIWREQLSGHFDIFYTQWSSSACGGAGCWTRADGITSGADNVSNNATDSYEGALALDNVNLAYVFWTDYAGGNADLYLAKWGLAQSGDVNITAQVDPNLTLTVSPAYCNFETFEISTIKTCNYNAIVTTNAVNGYTAFVKATGDMLNQSNPTYNLDNTTSGIGPNADKIDIGYEEYGIATSDTDTVAVTAKVADCAGENNSIEPVSAVSLSSGDLSFATATGPISDDTTTLCHVAAISGATVAGNYNQNIVITVVGNF